MTAETLERQAANIINDEMCASCRHCDCGTEMVKTLAENGLSIGSAAAVAAERERCAEVAAKWVLSGNAKPSEVLLRHADRLRQLILAEPGEDR